jgi:site-specific DNA recombinase
MRRPPGPDFRWGAVLRRSALNPDGTEGSTGRQEHAILEHVKANNLGRVCAIYRDIASAHDEKAKRPDFTNALEDLKAKRIDGLIAWKFDRFTRRRSYARRLLVQVEECGGRLATVVEGIDTADPAKREITEIALAIYAGSAESESEAIGQRITLMHLDRARKGLVHPNGARAFGHSADWRELVPAEVKVLEEAAERVLAGEALFAIAADFTERQIPTAKGGTRWYSDRLRQMLLSPRMVGKREYGGKLYALEGVPPILDVETWERVCAAIEQRANHHGPGVTHLLSSYAQCGACDRPLSAAKPGKGRWTYRCRPRFEGDAACRKITVVGDDADAVVASKVVAFLNDQERVKALLKTRASGPELDTIHERIAELSDNLLAVGAALNPPPGVPRMPLAVYYEQAAAIEAERKQLHARLGVRREASLLVECLDVEWTVETWDAKGLEWQRAILRLVTRSIVVEPRGKGSVQPGRNVFDPSRVVVTFADE